MNFEFREECHFESGSRLPQVHDIYLRFVCGLCYFGIGSEKGQYLDLRRQQGDKT